MATLRANVVIDRERIRARKALARTIEGLVSGGPAVTTIVRDVGDVDAKQNDQTFASQGIKSGKPWAALTPDYAALKKKLRPNRKILTFDGNLRDSLRHLSKPDHIARMRGDVLEFGTRHRLAVHHQHGTKRMVARPPVRKSPTQVKHLKLAIAKSLLLACGRESRGPLGTYLRGVAGTIHPDPRA